MQLSLKMKVVMTKIGYIAFLLVVTLIFFVYAAHELLGTATMSDTQATYE